jgi:hypothetical protein
VGWVSGGGGVVIPLYGIDPQNKGPPEIADFAKLRCRISLLNLREIGESVTK